MSMRPVSLRLERFRSFQREKIFTFSTRPSFNFIKGDNQVEPELEGNASGKSSLWEALTWVQFGKTSRKLIAGDIHTWGLDKGTTVSLMFETADDSTFAVTRTWNPNSLQIQAFRLKGEQYFEKNRDITQAQLEDIIGYNFDAWLNSRFMSQTEPRFLDLGAAQKSDILAATLDLDRWATYSETASGFAKASRAVTVELEKQVSHLEGQRSQLLLADYDPDIRQWQDDHNAQTQQLQNDIEIAVVAVGKLEVSCKPLAALEDNAIANETQVRGVIKEHEQKVREANAVANEVRDRKTTIQANINRHKQVLDFLSHNETCPTCKQEIQEDFLVATKTHAQNDLKDATERFNSTANEHSRKMEVVSGLERMLFTAKKSLDAATAERTKTSNDLQACRRSIQSMNASIERMDRELTNVLAQVNPYIKKKQEAEDVLLQCENEILLTTDSIDKSKREEARYSYWVKGFKELRLLLISEALVQLELEVNNAVLQLGLEDWRIEFAIDAENKTGGIKKGFNVLIYSPHNPKPVPWEAWSGGESQRLRLAAQMGLASLITVSSGIDCPLEVWDEPTTWMTEGGIEDLLETLKQRAVDNGSEIWIIDHRTLNFGGFDRTVTVVKDSNGSKFIE